MSDTKTDEVTALRARLAELERDLQCRRDAGQAACEAAGRIDTAFSHGAPSGSEDPATANDWDRVLRFARCGGSERVL